MTGCTGSLNLEERTPYVCLINISVFVKESNDSFRKNELFFPKESDLKLLTLYFLTEKACPDPGRPERGYRFGHMTVGSTMRFSCQSGFKLHGSEERICLENKEWTGSLTTCQNGSMYSSFTLATFFRIID